MLWLDKLKNIDSIGDGVGISLFIGFWAFFITMMVLFTSQTQYTFRTHLICVLIIIGVCYLIDKLSGYFNCTIFALIYTLILTAIIFPFFIGWTIPICALVIGEILFFCEKNKPKEKQNKFWYTAKRKFFNMFEVAVTMLMLGGVVVISFKGYMLLREYAQQILKVLAWVGSGAIIIGFVVLVIYMYVKVNSLKYKDKPRKVCYKRKAPKKRKRK